MTKDNENNTVHAQMQTMTVDTECNTDFTPQQLKQLAYMLFPLLLDSMEKHIEDTINSPLKRKCHEDDKKVQQHIKQLNANINKNESVVKGLKQQLNTWTKKVTNLTQHVNEVTAERQKEAKKINVARNKVEEFTQTHTKIKNNLQSLQKLKTELISQSVRPIDVDNKIDIVRKEFKSAIDSLPKESKTMENGKIDAVENSQNFINSKFEELKDTVTKESRVIKQHLNEHDGQIRLMANKVDKTQAKTKDNSQYLRRDCAVVGGVPEDGEEEDHKNHNEICKKKIISIFKELKLIVDPDKISILHRLKETKHSKPGQPRGVIVKFTSREVCHDVLQLRKSCKIKTSWEFDHRAKRIFINEALTPETRKLLYETKTSINKHLYDKHGIIYVWTYHGNIFIRKNADHAPKIMIKSNWDLYNVIKGFTSLDSPPPPPQETENQDTIPWWCNMKEYPPIPRY